MDEQEEANLLKELSEVLPKAGQVFAQQKDNEEILCKPKILPLKSITLQKLEQMEREVLSQAKISQKRD